MNDPAAAMPRIRRARGYRLYGLDGRRYLDLYQDGGRAILGHRGGRAVTAMKNALSEGLHSCLPSVHEARLLKALGRAFPAYRSFRLFASESRAFDVVSRLLGEQATASEILDPAICPEPEHAPRAARWRPFLPREQAAWIDGAEALLPVLPLAVGEAPTAVCFKAELAPDCFASDPLPGFLLAGVLAGICSLLGLDASGGGTGGSDDSDAAALASEGGLRPVLSALEGSPSWARRGRYVRALFGPGSHRGVHQRFLQGGVLLSPSHPGPSILPAECSPGEGKRLAGLFLGICGG